MFDLTSKMKRFSIKKRKFAGDITINACNGCRGLRGLGATAGFVF